jgi:hypothetical protein
MRNSQQITTRLIHPSRSAPDGFRSLAVPVFRGSTTLFPCASEIIDTWNHDEVPYTYGSYGTPTTLELAARIAALPGAAAEPPFAFEHDGVLLHGFLDALHIAEGRALVVDYKTNSLEEGEPEEIVENDYRLQRLVYAIACFRAGADEVEVVYHFLERPDAVVAKTFSRDDLPALEAELSAAITAINEGVFRPTPSEFVCSDCPALDLVCAGPRLRGAAAAPVTAAVAAG